MSKVVAELSMSLDGFVADASDGVDEVFAWYDAGDVEVPTASPELTFHVSEASARRLRDAMTNVGAEGKTTMAFHQAPFRSIEERDEHLEGTTILLQTLATYLASPESRS